MSISPAQSKDIQARRKACEEFLDGSNADLEFNRLTAALSFKAGWEAHKAHIKASRR